MVTMRGGARQTHRVPDVFVSFGEPSPGTGRCHPPRAVDGRANMTGCGLASVGAGESAGDGVLLGRGSFARRTPSVIYVTLGRIGLRAETPLPRDTGCRSPWARLGRRPVRSQPVRTSCSSVVIWEAMDSAHRGGKALPTRRSWRPG